MDRLMPLVYRELKRIAHRQLKAEAGGHTLSTTAVVHEAYLRLAGQSRAEFVDRGQFFALAARAMRRVLIDYARQTPRRATRGTGAIRSGTRVPRTRQFTSSIGSPARRFPARTRRSS
jgi:RNA polymerase sigma factor (TIGR02999 family)